MELELWIARDVGSLYPNIFAGQPAYENGEFFGEDKLGELWTHRKDWFIDEGCKAILHRGTVIDCKKTGS